jgi:dihydroorotase-like cyclic amidohydrolase
VTATAPTTASAELHGPVDFVLLEFPRDRLTGEASQALLDLVERGVIRLYDLLVISKNEDGSVEVLELGDPSGVDGFAYFSGARSGLLGDDDVDEASSAMRPGTVAALIVYENSWAIPFVAAARNSGGELIASARIPAPVVMEALEAMDSAAGTTGAESA